MLEKNSILFMQKTKLFDLPNHCAKKWKVYIAVKRFGLPAVKTVHSYGNCYSDWLTSVQQSVAPLREPQSILSGE